MEDILVTIFQKARTKAAQVHSDTSPPICNSVHSNKVTPTEANSLSLTGRRKSPTQS